MNELQNEIDECWFHEAQFLKRNSFMSVTKLHYHGKIVRTWTNIQKPILKAHLTEAGWILTTNGPRNGNCKVQAKPNQENLKKTIMHNLSDSSKWSSELVLDKPKKS